MIHSCYIELHTQQFLFLSLLIGSAPVIIEHPSDRAVLKNSAVDLVCRATGSPEPTIHWLHDGAKVEDDGRRNVLSSGTLHFLRVTRGRKRTDSGIYQCVASNRYGTVYSKNASFVVGCKLEPDSMSY